MALMFPRLARNFIRNGYFPTDEPTLERALSALAPSPGSMSILDPCAGEGVAIAEAAHALGREQVQAFAVEYDARTGTFGHESKGFACHTDFVRGIEFLDDDTMLTVADDGTAVEWSLRTAQPTRQMKLHDEPIMAMAAARDSAASAPHTLVTGCADGVVRIWRMPFTAGRVNAGKA